MMGLLRMGTLFRLDCPGNPGDRQKRGEGQFMRRAVANAGAKALWCHGVGVTGVC
jgi:hypothetical protein